MAADAIQSFFVHNPVLGIVIVISAAIAALLYLLGFKNVFKKQVKRRRMKHRVESLKDHYIVCGFGRIGKQIATELANKGQPFIVLEKDESKLKLANDSNWVYLLGDAALDESVLENAQIKSAKAIIVAVGIDADAIFISISAKSLRPDIFIVARASSTDVAGKLHKIGVNQVALPHRIGGYHMTTMAMRPTVVGFLDLLIDSERSDVEMDELTVAKDGPYDGKSLEEIGIFTHGISVPFIRRRDGKFDVNPPPDTKVTDGDCLVILGGEKQLQPLTQALEGHDTVRLIHPGTAKPVGLGAEIKANAFHKK